MRLRFFALAVVVCSSVSPFVAAQVTVTSGQPVIGSSNPVSPEPPVARPATKPCVVTLFSNLEFADYNAKTFSYTPPASCPGPWAKVVFTADFTVTAGIQYDRTGSFYLGHANLWFGTTAEPAPGFSPSWHVEKDVTDLSTVFTSAQAGEADLGNFVGVYNGTDYNGIIYANAALEFYPVAANAEAPVVPDVVIPVPDAAGGPVFVASFENKLSQAFTLPQNTEQLYLDVYAQSQSNDEFWWFCVPSEVAAEIDTCGGTGFRETEVTVDGIPAGAAPVYPWIYTGGVDPNLWIPIPGVQTLDFKPYRVNLTPFAGKLNDGKQHTVGIGVDNAQNGFNVIATLSAYLDHGATVDPGGVAANDIKFEPVYSNSSSLATDAYGDLSGSVSTTSARSFYLNGNLHTSHGAVSTDIVQTMNFATTQYVLSDASEYVEDVSQQTTVSTQTTVKSGGRSSTVTDEVSYPFSFDYVEVVNPDGSVTLTSTSSQTDLASQSAGTQIGSATRENVTSKDALQFDANFNFLSSAGSSSASYSSNSGVGNSYSESLASDNYVLTGAETTVCTAGSCTTTTATSPDDAAVKAASVPHPAATDAMPARRPAARQ